MQHRHPDRGRGVFGGVGCGDVVLRVVDWRCHCCHGRDAPLGVRSDAQGPGKAGDGNRVLEAELQLALVERVRHSVVLNFGVTEPGFKNVFVDPFLRLVDEADLIRSGSRERFANEKVELFHFVW